MKEMKRLTIDADYDAVLWDENGCAYTIDDDDVIELDDCMIRVPGLNLWHRDFVDAVDWPTLTASPRFDWHAWHARGLELAAQLRKQLPDHYELWYQAPFEDISGTIADKILISKT